MRRSIAMRSVLTTNEDQDGGPFPAIGSLTYRTRGVSGKDKHLCKYTVRQGSRIKTGLSLETSLNFLRKKLPWNLEDLVNTFRVSWAQNLRETQCFIMISWHWKLSRNLLHLAGFPGTGNPEEILRKHWNLIRFPGPGNPEEALNFLTISHIRKVKGTLNFNCVFSVKKWGQSISFS